MRLDDPCKSQEGRKVKKETYPLLRLFLTPADGVKEKEIENKGLTNKSAS